MQRERKCALGQLSESQIYPEKSRKTGPWQKLIENPDQIFFFPEALWIQKMYLNLLSNH